MFDWRVVPGDLSIAIGLSFDDVLAMLVCAGLAIGWRKKAQVWVAGIAGTMAMLTACLMMFHLLPPDRGRTTDASTSDNDHQKPEQGNSSKHLTASVFLVYYRLNESGIERRER
jgi:hypothetical protein